MKKLIKNITICVLAIAMIASLCACDNSGKSEDSSYTMGNAESVYKDAHIIKLNGSTASLDGTDLEVFDYTWHCDPSTVHDEVKNAPAEYYTGTKPETNAAAYIDSELYYFPELDITGFKKVNYDGENEYAYYYTDGENNDYIFATLPVLGSNLPTDMMHTEEEAAKNKVLHICEAGTYILEGQWNGQIWVDLGDSDDTFTDESAKITVILNGVDITCTVAPGVVFYSAYECDNTWEDQESWSYQVDTSNAGVNVVIADGSVNNVDGQNIYRMLKTKYKDEDSTDAVKTQKKMRKIDAAFYSFVTMNINGGDENTGVLNVTSGFEGLDSELHMSLNGGNINIKSQDDGMNVNEDDVSVLILNGSNVYMTPALGAEGDGIDSNGYIVLNSGSLSCDGVTAPDSVLDSECGAYYFGGTVTIDGEVQSYQSGDVIREQMGGQGNQNGQGGGQMGPGGQFGPGGQGGPNGQGGGQFGPGGQGSFDPENIPEGFDPENIPEGFDPENIPEGFDPENIPEDFDPENMPEGFNKDNKGNFDPSDLPEGFDPSNGNFNPNGNSGSNPMNPNGNQGQQPNGNSGQNPNTNNGQTPAGVNGQAPNGNGNQNSSEIPNG